MDTRIPFEEAITDKLLLAKAFNRFSLPQQVMLKAFYGQPLNDEELTVWAVLQGMCEYDDLGYPTKIYECPYVPKEYEQLWGIIGRRSGKSFIGGFIFAYEATLGGHTSYADPSQPTIMYNVAQNLRVAEATLKFVESTLITSPLLKKEMVDAVMGTITFKNGIKVVASSPSLRGQRGLAVPVTIMDEVGFWYNDPDSANPDTEVETAIRFSQLQFPNRKRIGISTPYTKQGLLWKYAESGTEGCRLSPSADKSEYADILVCYAPTAAMQNPVMSSKEMRKALRKAKAADPENYIRESLAKFTDSISGFFNEAGLKRAINVGVNQIAPSRENMYIAAIDPAFRKDNFAFTIVHRDKHLGIVQDYVTRWVPPKGSRLNPEFIFDEIVHVLRAYNIPHVYSDQYQLEALQQIALSKGFTIEGLDFTARSKAKIYGNLLQLVNSNKLRLLDPSVNLAAKEQFQELLTLEKHNREGGSMSIAAPEGWHDDLASVVALSTYKAVWLLPEEKKNDIPKEPTLFERGMASIRRGKQAHFEDDNWV